MHTAKKAAAERAVREHVREGQVIGIGSGSTVVYVVEAISELMKSGALKSIRCVPSSFQAENLLKEGSLPVLDLCHCASVIDVCIDGADEVDSELNLIKGGGGCHTKEKIVASLAKKFVVVADDSKRVVNLGSRWTRGIPVEVIPSARYHVKHKLEEIGGDASIRESVNKAGPLITDNGNVIIDWKCVHLGSCTTSQFWINMQNTVSCIPGVLDVGIFIQMAHLAYFASSHGNVTVLEPQLKNNNHAE